MNITLVLNRDAGTLRGLDPGRAAAELAEVFRERGHQVHAEIHSGRAAVAAIARVCRERRCDAIVVGGGDGTISGAAAAVAHSGVALGVLPLGTMNLFARSLRIPFGMRAAAEALAAGNTANVDIGEVNGRHFIHHVTLGLHPRIVRMRERLSYSSRPGKIWTGIQAWWTVLRKPPRLNARIAAGGHILVRPATAILVSNNPLGEGHLPYADDLRQGRLGLYVTTSRRWADLVELAARMSLGEFSGNPLLESWQAERIEIWLDRDLVRASVDGEIVTLRAPLRIAVHKGGLKVLQPGKTAAALRSGGNSVAAKDGTGAQG